MPKAKYREDRHKKTVARTYKYKIGGRKSNTRAHSMSTAELLKLYFEPKLKKDTHKIATVLRLRNVEIVAPVAEVEETV